MHHGFEKNVVGFFVAAQSHADAHSLSHRGMGERMGCVEVRKLLDIKSVDIFVDIKIV